MIILGISGYLGHDAGAGLVVNGQVVAACQEERFTRIKHDKAFPRQSIQACLEQAGLTPADITDVVFTEEPYRVITHDRLKRLPPGLINRVLGNLPITWASSFHRQAAKLLPAARHHVVTHHEAHVTASWLMSGFDEAAYLCIDGKGEDYCTTMGVVSANGHTVMETHPYENGLGMFYTIMTHYLGFLTFGAEYKMMGLAPYGRPVYRDTLQAMFHTDEQGHFRLNVPYEWRKLDANRELQELLGHPMRMPDEPLEPYHADIAASAQAIFEDEILKLARRIRDLSGHTRNLVFTGGCAQNCVAGGRLHRAGLFDRVYVSPVASDMSTGLGAAIQMNQQNHASTDITAMRSLYLGPEPGELPREAENHRLDDPGDLHEYIARQLAEGLVVGWVRGRMELGPRALGARSILADPRRPDARERMNTRIKFRETFRPFAPSVLAEHVSDWFDFHGRADYMNMTARLLEKHRGNSDHEARLLPGNITQPDCSVPGVIHVDYSARIQTVHPDIHPDFHRLISAFHHITGIPMLINTSFNLAGEPIVCTGKDTWHTFTRSGIDLLVVDDSIYTNPAGNNPLH